MGEKLTKSDVAKIEEEINYGLFVYQFTLIGNTPYPWVQLKPGKSSTCYHAGGTLKLLESKYLGYKVWGRSEDTVFYRSPIM